ncbi:putative uncharacterized protein [Bacteroides sp. CAG:530]|jgi:uncharacterized metal-binding protein YceD (DUF177 family)|nr:putative uncharacterized protein [Bacteroides sp. CAG:530]
MRENSAHYEFELDNEFFASIDAPEIQKGKLNVSLDVKKSIGVFVLNFHTEGMIIVPCDRCLDDMELEIATDDSLKVKLGTDFSDENDIVVVPEEDGYINVAWFIYEFIALQIPMKHVHAPGKCNKGMLGALHKHLSTSADDAEDDDLDFGETEESGAYDDMQQDSEPIDPRWNDLKKILNNN